jgi:hypothetical protein
MIITRGGNIMKLVYEMNEKERKEYIRNKAINKVRDKINNKYKCLKEK